MPAHTHGCRRAINTASEVLTTSAASSPSPPPFRRRRGPLLRRKTPRSSRVQPSRACCYDACCVGTRGVGVRAESVRGCEESVRGLREGPALLPELVQMREPLLRLVRECEGRVRNLLVGLGLRTLVLPLRNEVRLVEKKEEVVSGSLGGTKCRHGRGVRTPPSLRQHGPRCPPWRCGPGRTSASVAAAATAAAAYCICLCARACVRSGFCSCVVSRQLVGVYTHRHQPDVRNAVRTCACIAWDSCRTVQSLLPRCRRRSRRPATRPPPPLQLRPSLVLELAPPFPPTSRCRHIPPHLRQEQHSGRNWSWVRWGGGGGSLVRCVHDTGVLRLEAAALFVNALVPGGRPIRRLECEPFGFRSAECCLRVQLLLHLVIALVVVVVVAVGGSRSCSRVCECRFLGSCKSPEMILLRAWEGRSERYGRVPGKGWWLLEGLRLSLQGPCMTLATKRGPDG